MILIIPIGNIDGDMVTGVSAFVESYYSRLGLSVRILRPLPERYFNGAFNGTRGQYLGRLFLPPLAKIREREGETAALGITSLDLYEEELNFIFGLAHPGLRTAVISTFRLRPELYGNAPNGQILEKRAVKEAMHELGHVFGLPHCPEVRCVMHFSNSIADTDVKSPYYCGSCLNLLKRNLGVFL